MLTSDQEARVRFAHRLWSTGCTCEAPAATVKAARELCDKVVEAWGQVREITPEDFKRTATAILNNSEN